MRVFGLILFFLSSASLMGILLHSHAGLSWQLALPIAAVFALLFLLMVDGKASPRIVDSAMFRMHRKQGKNPPDDQCR